MSPGFQALLVYIALTAIFDVWYFFARRELKKLAWKLLFFLNMLFGVLMVTAIAQQVLKSFDVSNNLMNLCLFVMALAIILHHASLLLLTHRRDRSKILEFIHIPLSHVLLGVPYVLTAIIGAVIFSHALASVIDLTIYIIWFLETTAFGVVFVLVGLRILKLPWK